MKLIPASKEEVDKEPSVMAMILDIQRTMEHQRFTPDYGIVAYIYGTTNRRLYCIIGDDIDLLVCRLTDDKGQPVGALFLWELHELYQEYFIGVDNEAKKGLHDVLSKGIYECWQKIYYSFIVPILGIGRFGRRIDVLCKFEAQVRDTHIQFNLPMCHNLSFLHLDYKENKPLYLTWVTDESFYDYFMGDLQLLNPTPENMVFVTGIGGLDDTLPPEKASEERFVIRHSILQDICCLILQQGGACQRLEGIGDLKALFAKGSNRNVIQLLAHHRDGKLEAHDGSIILVSDIVRETEDLRVSGRLQPNIVLDAINCENHISFRELKAAGIRRIYYGYNLLSTDISIFQLLEMYQGDFARRLRWPFPYLDGTRRLNAIYADIIRAQYVSMNINGELKVSLQDIHTRCKPDR